MSKAKVIAGLGVLALIGTMGYHFWKSRQGTFYYAGTIEATKVDVPARLASVITQVEAREGGKVKAGQTLVQLACEDIRIQADLAKSTFDRGQRLVKAGSMPQEAFDQLKSKRDEIKLKLDWCSIDAPINGTVLTTYHEVGEWVAPGTRLLTLADLDEVWAYIYVPQTMLAKIHLGMNVPGYLPEIGMSNLQGVVVKINEEAEFTPRNVQTREERTRLVYGVKVQFKNSADLLKPGMPIEVDLPEQAL
ncbi:MAG: efflux RND transporter periplasmic adaptor subunit [Pseudobdellovibrionaceae bacterium]|nr:efflux RND transporter periplasmic adaptor subunit [Pseudobdellovibrionaceae bacterium]